MLLMILYIVKIFYGWQIRMKNVFFEKPQWVNKKKETKPFELISFLQIEAVRGGFEPPVRLPVRQFSKLVVSATHPSHQTPLFRFCVANVVGFSETAKHLKGKF